MISLEQSLVSKVFTHKQLNVTADFNKIGNSHKDSIQCAIVLGGKIDRQWLGMVIESVSNIILADGGANYFYQTQYRDSKNVKCLVGDLDSVKPDILKYYREKDVEICKIQNQNHTDFQKSLIKASSLGFKNCICLGALGGRMDHTLSAIHLTTKLSKLFEEMEIVLEGDSNLMYFLRGNVDYKIKIPKWIERTGCGIVTFNKIQNISTTGFKWNLGEGNEFSSLQWGSFISTSNQIVEDEISIKSSNSAFLVCRMKQNSSEK